MKTDVQKFYGCLIGGAVGDAFGAPIKMMNYDTILKLYGKEGLGHLIKESKEGAFITDATQMTLFTAEGLIRSVSKAHKNNIKRESSMTVKTVFRAYLRWLYTQGLKTPHWNPKDYDGWLIKVQGLHAYREPGITSITTLGKGIMGSINKPLNDSKGCGGVMRIAPVGLIEDEAVIFDEAANIAAITHGHITGCMASGTLAMIIYYLKEGDDLKEAIEKALYILKGQEKSEECVRAIEKALCFAKTEPRSSEKIKAIGVGFVAEEALAISLYCALSYPNDFNAALKLGVNSDGDSAIIGSLTGNILGTYLGANAIDEKLIEGIELSKEIKKIAYDLYEVYEEHEIVLKDYPAW